MGCNSNYANQAVGDQYVLHQTAIEDCRSPEAILAEAFKKDLGVTMDPQALRIFIRWRWDRVQKLAHKIHDAA